MCSSSFTRTLKRNTQRCLSGNVRTVAHGAMSFQVLNTTYHPTLRLTKKRAEIHLQQRHRGGVISVTKAPADGYYLLVADVISMRNGKSSVALYRPRRGYQNITGSVKGWIAGTDSSCPDLTKTK